MIEFYLDTVALTNILLIVLIVLQLRCQRIFTKVYVYLRFKLRWSLHRRKVSKEIERLMKK